MHEIAPELRIFGVSRIIEPFGLNAGGGKLTLVDIGFCRWSGYVNISTQPLSQRYEPLRTKTSAGMASIVIVSGYCVGTSNAVPTSPDHVAQ